MHLYNSEKGLSTAFNEIVESELRSVERSMDYYKKKMIAASVNGGEFGEVERIVYSAALSYLRSQYEELKKYNLVTSVEEIKTTSFEAPGFTEA
ncbi:MAG: hypothetical protein GSR83_02125 [Desulfurococcales archaeon]|nr:hypothetical protein [Desulfurococcales archaeon]MEB3798868.1 hypothetical protein [Desulfurococcales archaeon]MEB3845828.1 hypothetical protein [Desulfurococcales archaeon]